MERCVLLLNIYCMIAVLRRRTQCFFPLQGIIFFYIFQFFGSDLPF